MIIRRKKTTIEPQKKEEPKIEPEIQKQQVQKPFVPNYDILNDIDIDSIAQERFERRRGDRRRGYRRIDDRNLISRAEEEAKLVKENAQKEGFNQGLRIAQEQLLAFRTASEEFMHAKEASIEIIQDDLTDLALKIAKKIIKREVSIDKTIVLSIISDVLKEIGKGEKHIILKVHPDDADTVRENLPNLFPSLQSEVKMLIEADDTVEAGSCIVETKNGLVDARISTQLEILQNAFIENL